MQTDADDNLYFLSTSGRGFSRLPFALHNDNQTSQNIAVDSNGVIVLAVTNTGTMRTQDLNQCLPTSVFGHPAVAPYGDDLDFRTADQWSHDTARTSA